MRLIKYLLVVAIMGGGLYAGDVTTLSQVIEQSEKKGYKLKIEQTKLIQASARIRQQWSKVFPQVSARIERIHNDLRGTRSLSYSTNLDIDPIDAHRIRGSLQQLLYDPKFPKQVKLADLELIMATHTYDQIKLDQRLDIAMTYFEMASLQEQVALSKHEEKVLGSHLTEIKNKKVLKQHTQEEVLKIEVDLDKVEQNTSQLNQTLRLTIAKLNHGMGNHAKDALIIDTGALDPVLYLDVSDSLGALETAWEKRSDVQIMKSELHHLNIQKQMLEQNYWPVITLSMDYGSAHESKFSPYFADRDYSWNLGGTINLFDGFDTTFKLKEVQAKIDQKTFEIEFKKLEIQSEINDSLYKLQLAQQKLKDADTQLRYAEEKLNGAKKKYAKKIVTQLHLFYTEKFFHESQTQKVIARLELAKAAAQFKYFLGKTPTKM